MTGITGNIDESKARVKFLVPLPPCEGSFFRLRHQRPYLCLCPWFRSIGLFPKYHPVKELPFAFSIRRRYSLMTKWLIEIHFYYANASLLKSQSVILLYIIYLFLFSRFLCYYAQFAIRKRNNCEFQKMIVTGIILWCWSTNNDCLFFAYNVNSVQYE